MDTPPAPVIESGIMDDHTHSRLLLIGFLASIAFLVILALVSAAFGQEHPFPFKTLEDITTGTPAWVPDGLPEQ